MYGVALRVSLAKYDIDIPSLIMHLLNDRSFCLCIIVMAFPLRPSFSLCIDIAYLYTFPYGYFSLSIYN